MHKYNCRFATPKFLDRVLIRLGLLKPKFHKWELLRDDKGRLVYFRGHIVYFCSQCAQENKYTFLEQFLVQVKAK